MPDLVSLGAEIDGAMLVYERGGRFDSTEELTDVLQRMVAIAATLWEGGATSAERLLRNVANDPSAASASIA